MSAQVLSRFAGEHGLPQSACLRGTGITADALADPGAEITAAQELELVRNLQRGLGHLPGLGLEAGLRYHLSTYGIWGFALLSSPTLRSASEVVERYLDLSYAFVRFRIVVQPDAARILLDDREIPDDVRQFLLERDFAAWTNAMREMQPVGVPLRRVQFRFPSPVYAPRFRELCGIAPCFDAADNSIWFDAALIDAPLPQGNPVMTRLCLEQCHQLLEKRKLRTGTAGQVRDRLFQMAGTMPSLERVAGELHLSSRSLRRHLEAEGTNFRALADEVLEALAEQLLTVAGMKLEEVATRLGYAEPASFIHAFKRWKGVSPNAYREAQRRA